MRGDLLGDHVAFEHVLERGDLEAHLFGEPDEHQDLVGAIAVGVHEPLAFEDLDQGFELQIAPRRQRAARLVLLVVLPRLLVGLGARERVADHVLDAHARHRISARAGLAAADRHVLRVLAERELDARQRAFEDDLFSAASFPSAA